MKARYYVVRNLVSWAVRDRHDRTEVAVFVSRSDARARARELNIQDRLAETKEEARHGI
jgi:hypothetical protein